MSWANIFGSPLRGGGSKKEAFNVTVRGRVQGVGFRWWVRNAAERYGVRGWVANRDDGSVEIFAEGKPDDLARFLIDAEQGPPYSRVEAFVKSPAEPEGFRDFSIRGY